MALSGTYLLNISALELYTEVLEILQVIGDGETITTAMKDKITPSLNNMLKSWEAQGLNLWGYTEGSLFLQVGQSEYDFRDSDTKLTNEFFQTALTQAEILGASTVTLDDVTDVATLDVIGIIDDTNTLFFTTISGLAGSVATLTDVLPTAVVEGAVVYTYKPTPAFVPVRRVLNVRRRESSDYEIPINFESREDYFDLPNKNQRGLPIQAYYSRQEPQGIMYLWTTPDNAQSVINFTYERERQIITADADNFDIPSYWFEALAYNVAKRAAYKFSTSPERKAAIDQDAMVYLNEALSFDDAVYPIEIKVQQYG